VVRETGRASGEGEAVAETEATHRLAAILAAAIALTAIRLWYLV
jgi:hypothetical protein